MAIASLFAGFIDAVVGGGGLIQFPAFMILFPNSSIPTAFGTNKIAGLSGTSIAAVQYAKRVTFNWKLLLITALPLTSNSDLAVLPIPKKPDKEPPVNFRYFEL